MTYQEITHQRFEGWKKKLAADNATPLVLVGIGHEHTRGKTFLILPENGPSQRQIAQLLRGVADQLEASGN